MDEKRMRFIKTREDGGQGGTVVCWLRRALRVTDNPSLEAAAREARRRGMTLEVCFWIGRDPRAMNLRQYAFYLEGILEAARTLQTEGVAVSAFEEEPEAYFRKRQPEIALLVTDKPYLRACRRRVEALVDSCGFAIAWVDGNVTAPVASVYPKEAYQASILRRRLMEGLETPGFLSPGKAFRPLGGNRPPAFEPVEKRIRSALSGARRHKVAGFDGGEMAALERLFRFVDEKIDAYGASRNDPGREIFSDLSPYLHFGNISPGMIVERLGDLSLPGRRPFVEELVVRRELAFNFVHYNPDYDRLSGLPNWARDTLEKHALDPRPRLYAFEALESGLTEDPYWNAAQWELREGGKTHPYMRMYWCKKLMEWTPSPGEALETALSLNNTWSLDGFDPNSYAGILWCFGKHDRPWRERPVFGKVRVMTRAGLERKFDMPAYLKRIERRKESPYGKSD